MVNGGEGVGHWSAGPHLFIDDYQIWLFTPLTIPGVHSPLGTKPVHKEAPTIAHNCIGKHIIRDEIIQEVNSHPGQA